MNSNDNDALEEEVEQTDEVAGDMAAEYLQEHLPEEPGARADDDSAPHASFAAKVRTFFKR